MVSGRVRDGEICQLRADHGFFDPDGEQLARFCEPAQHTGPILGALQLQMRFPVAVDQRLLRFSDQTIRLFHLASVGRGAVGAVGLREPSDMICDGDAVAAGNHDGQAGAPGFLLVKKTAGILPDKKTVPFIQQLVTQLLPQPADRESVDRIGVSRP